MGVGCMGGCQIYGPFLDPYRKTAPNIQGTPKRDHNFDNHPYGFVACGVFDVGSRVGAHRVQDVGARVQGVIGYGI